MRALRTIAVSTTTKYRDDAALLPRLRDEFAGQRRKIAQRIIGMRVVDNDREGLAAVDALETSGDPLESTNAGGGDGSEPRTRARADDLRAA